MFKRLKKRYEFFKELEKNRKDKKLFLQIIKKYDEVIAARGDKKKLRLKAKEYFIVKTRFEKTKLYDYIKYDAKVIDAKVKEMMKHPKDHKIGYLLASFYIVSPGTFELTGVFLFFRYIGKYIWDIKKKD